MVSDYDIVIGKGNEAQLNSKGRKHSQTVLERMKNSQERKSMVIGTLHTYSMITSSLPQESADDYDDELEEFKK